MSDTTRENLTKSALLIGGLVVTMWVLELIDTLTANSLDRFGIRPWDPSTLLLIPVSDFLHLGWDHLAANTIPFAVLGFVIRFTAGFVRWLVTTVITSVISGLTVWLMGPLNSITIGASGLIFGWLTYLLARGVFSRDWKQIAIAVVIFLLYGSVLWGVLPGTAGVSWQAHLGGAVGGVVAAWFLHARADQPAGTR